jgi:hypothetical protein
MVFRVFEFTNTGTTLLIYAVQSTASSTVLSKQTDCFTWEIK